MERATGGRSRSRQAGRTLPAYRVGDLALSLLLGLAAGANVLTAIEDAGNGKAGAGLHHLVVAVALGLNACLFLLRGPAVARSAGFLPKVVALTGSWMLPPLSMLPITWGPGWLLGVSTAAIILAYTLVIWALMTLRASFSVFPEARQLVRSGPYGLIRHPLYSAYVVTYVAMLLPRLSTPALLIAAAGIGAELWRVRFEERLLRDVFPEYRPYAEETPRFLPAVALPWRTRSPRSQGTR